MWIHEAGIPVLASQLACPGLYLQTETAWKQPDSEGVAGAAFQAVGLHQLFPPELT